ncbi:MAG TPA: hypothetical protein VM432_05300 [Bdellovibrionales bacterium]|nr:hypothetical protein [Bdellovibrionales bacterium]
MDHAGDPDEAVDDQVVVVLVAALDAVVAQGDRDDLAMAAALDADLGAPDDPVDLVAAQGDRDDPAMAAALDADLVVLDDLAMAVVLDAALGAAPGAVVVQVARDDPVVPVCRDDLVAQGDQAVVHDVVLRAAVAPDAVAVQVVVPRAAAAHVAALRAVAQVALHEAAVPENPDDLVGQGAPVVLDDRDLAQRHLLEQLTRRMLPSPIPVR